MNYYRFDDDLHLLKELPDIKEIQYVDAYLPQTVVVRSTTLCVDINISPVQFAMKDTDGNCILLNKGLSRFHTVYVSDPSRWLPILQLNLDFWLHAARKNKDLTDYLNEQLK